jgi:hypothetical protein
MSPPCRPLQVLAVWWQGPALHGIMRLLETPAGRLAALLLADGQHLGASMRCWTSVQHDCQLIT